MSAKTSSIVLLGFFRSVASMLDARSLKFVQLLSAGTLGVAVTVGAFVGGIWAALGIGLSMILWGFVAIKDHQMPVAARNLSILTVLTLAVFAAEIPLSSDVKISTHLCMQLASIFVPLLFLTSTRLQQVSGSSYLMSVIATMAGVGALALGCELESGGVLLQSFKKTGASLTEYNRGMAHVAILAFPIFANLWIKGDKRSAIVLALIFLFPASLTESHTAKLALVLGTGATIAAFFRPVWVERAFLATAVALMGWPYYAQIVFAQKHDAIEQWHSSWRHRMEIWDYLSYRISDRPFFGWGLGTTHLLDFSQPHGNWYQALTVHGAPHAHNFITEVWVETGALGLALCFAFLVISLRSTRSLHASLRPFALGGWMAAVTISMFGFDFWTDSLWAAFALSAFAFGVVDQRIKSCNDVAHI